jgi:hypothetical protein
MKRLLLFASLIFLTAFSCDKEEYCEPLADTCSVANPVKGLPWLQAEVQLREQNNSDISQYLYIMQAKYNQETVFIYGNCCPMCDTNVPVLNCEGEVLFYLGQDSTRDKKISNQKIIWKGKDFSCTIN